MDDRDREELKKKLRAGNFKENTGRVLRTINILRHEFNKLTAIVYALQPSVEEDEVLDAVNYLHEAGYIHLRNIETKEYVMYGLSDIGDYKLLEAKLTAKGISLLGFGITDPMVKV